LQSVAVEREQLTKPSKPNEVWSMDFVSDALVGGRRIKALTIVYDFTKELVCIALDHGISGHYVTRVLDQAIRLRDAPEAINLGTEKGLS
jgi:putative transposase